jgi:hypothetical protein
LAKLILAKLIFAESADHCVLVEEVGNAMDRVAHGNQALGDELVFG